MVSTSPPSSDSADARADVVGRHRGLVGRTVLVSVLTLLSRILGFVREVVTAIVFGDGSAISDAFFTAWRVPNLFRRLLGEGALSTALQTALTEADAEQGEEGGRRLFLSTLRVAGLILLGVTVLAMIAVALMPDRMPGTGWAWLGSDPAPVRDLALWLLPFVILVCLAALAGGALYVRGHFLVPNLSSSALNVVWILVLIGVAAAYGWEDSLTGDSATVFQRQWDMARLVAIGVLVGGVLQLALHLPPLLRRGLLKRRAAAVQPSSTGPARGAWTVLRTSAPLALGAAVYQINVMIDGLMAEGLLTDGGPTALYYANRIQQFPLALVAIAAINSVFPSLKALGHTGRLGELASLHRTAQLGVAFLAVPAAVGLAMLSEPIAAVLFEHGNYTSTGVERISEGLVWLACALLPAGAVGLLGRTFYALGDFRTPVFVASVFLVVNALLNVLFVRVLGHDVGGLTLATALSSWGQLIWLLPRLRRRLEHGPVPQGEPSFARRITHVVGASALAGLFAWGTQAGLEALYPGPTAFVGWSAWRAGALCLTACVGIASYLGLAHWWGLPEWTLFRERWRARRSNAKGA